MKGRRTSLLLGLIVAVAIAAVTWYIRTHDIALFNPAGIIAEKEFRLLALASAMTLIVGIPVFFMVFYFTWKYQEDNEAEYKPNWDTSLKAEAVWWLVPLALITVLAVITWKTTHDLDPFKPLKSDKQPITIQVVAMQWKWLFLYPDHNIATVNYIKFPEDRPVNFVITSDAPMNSFWIPELGGQIYAMTGMSTKLHLEASQQGSFKGLSANISGEGFAGMKFRATATSEIEFAEWIKAAQASDDVLDAGMYKKLAIPSKDNKPETFLLKERNLYDSVIMKYTGHGGHDMTHYSEL